MEGKRGKEGGLQRHHRGLWDRRDLPREKAHWLGRQVSVAGKVRLTGSDVLLQVHYIGEAGQFRRNLVRKQVNTTCQHLIQDTKKDITNSLHTHCLLFRVIQNSQILSIFFFQISRMCLWYSKSPLQLFILPGEISYKRPLSWIQLKRRKTLKFLYCASRTMSNLLDCFWRGENISNLTFSFSQCWSVWPDSPKCPSC